MEHVRNADRDHWQCLWDKAIHRLPILKEVKHPNIYNCPDNFTPDSRWILGESPEVKNYFVAVGMNGNSLQGILLEYDSNLKKFFYYTFLLYIKKLDIFSYIFFQKVLVELVKKLLNL